jgi:hypothetical protein
VILFLSLFFFGLPGFLQVVGEDRDVDDRDSESVPSHFGMAEPVCVYSDIWSGL